MLSENDFEFKVSDIPDQDTIVVTCYIKKTWTKNLLRLNRLTDNELNLQKKRLAKEVINYIYFDVIDEMELLKSNLKKVVECLDRDAEQANSQLAMIDKKLSVLSVIKANKNNRNHNNENQSY